MRKSKREVYLWLTPLVLIFTAVAWAKLALGEVKPGSYQLTAITNHTPALFKKDKDYWKSFQKVSLQIGNQQQFRDLPKLGLKKPFTGFIELGDKPEKFGVLVDIVGEEKRLYIDTDGDGSFAGELWVPLLNEWLGIQNYWVLSPEPVNLKIGYNSKPGKSYPLQISVEGVLSIPGAFSKEKPYLLVEVRTWFLAKVTEDNAEKYLAIVDRNNNGKFNDPDDAIVIDYNNDGFFSREEMVLHKKGVTLKSGQQRLNFDWDAYPDNLAIGGKNQ